MKAIIRTLTKKMLPHPVSGEPALHVQAEVDFTDAAGKVVHSQQYAHLPENTDPEYYQRQADVMQNDLDLAANWASEALQRGKSEAAADSAIQEIGQHFKLNFQEEVPIHDVKN